MNLIDQWQYHCDKAELTPDLVTHIRNFPVRQILLAQDLWRILPVVGDLTNFAKFIPSLVCALYTDDILILF